MLTNRILSLLESITLHCSGIKVSDLANMYAISPRAVYHDIEELVYFIRQEHLAFSISVDNGLVRCDSSEASMLTEEYLVHLLGVYAEQVVLTREERLLEVLYHLLKGNTIRIAPMMQDFDISKSTVTNDMDAMKRFFGSYSVRISAASSAGFSLKGSEVNIRLAACHYLEELLTSNNVIGRMHTERALWTLRPYRLYLQDTPFHVYETAAKDALKSVNLTYRLIDSCICAMLVSLLRGSTDKSMLTEEERSMLQGTDVCTAACAMAASLFSSTSWPSNQALTDLLSLNMLSSGPDYRRALYLNQSIDLRVLATNFASEVCTKLGAPVRTQLLHGLKNELFQQITRRDDGMRAWDEQVVQSLRHEYDTLYQIVEESSDMIATACGGRLSERQLVYLMLNFIELYEQHASEEKAPDVLVVCNSGTVVSRILSSKLQMTLNVNIVDVISVYEAAEYLNHHTVDYIVSTVPVFSGKTRSIIVSPMLTEGDIRTLREELLPRRGSATPTNVEHPSHSGASLTQLIQEDCIRLDADCQALSEAVRISARLLEAQGYTEPAYTEDLLKAVKEHGRFMLIGPNMIMPHSMAGRYVRQTAMSVVRLQQPVRLEDADFEVRWIFTLCTVDRVSHLTALTQLAQMIGNPEAMSSIDDAVDAQDLKQILKKYENDQM